MPEVNIETPASAIRILHSGRKRDKTVVGTLPGCEITRGVGFRD